MNKIRTLFLSDKLCCMCLFIYSPFQPCKNITESRRVFLNGARSPRGSEQTRTMLLHHTLYSLLREEISFWNRTPPQLFTKNKFFWGTVSQVTLGYMRIYWIEWWSSIEMICQFGGLIFGLSFCQVMSKLGLDRSKSNYI